MLCVKSPGTVRIKGYGPRPAWGTMPEPLFSRPLILQFDDGCAAPAFLRRRQVEFFNLGVVGEHVVQGLPQGSFSMAMDNPQPGAAAQRSLVQEFVHALACFFRRVPNDVELLWNLCAGGRS